MTDKKKVKELVEAILSKQDKSYEDWLQQKHLEFIAENSDIVITALNGKKE